jgi:hypothetical protein
VQQPEGFPLLIGQYPDVTGVYHLSHNEVLTSTTRHVGAEGGYMRCDNGVLYCEKVKLPNRQRPVSMARIDGRDLVVAYEKEVYARGTLIDQLPDTPKVAANPCNIVSVWCNRVAIYDPETYSVRKRYEWHVSEQLRDVKISLDGLVVHIAYKNSILRFDLDQ